jgi:hypothetical protein
VPATEDRKGGGALVKSEQGEVGNAAYPELSCSSGVVDEVCEVVAELWAWWSRLRCCDARARAQRSNGGGGVSVLHLERARGRQGEVRRWRVHGHGFPLFKLARVMPWRSTCARASHAVTSIYHRSAMTESEDFESEFIRPTDNRFCSYNISQTSPILVMMLLTQLESYMSTTNLLIGAIAGLA